ncbi:MAG: hypothetical protein IH991_03910, partial [Planctomycetes bacterium]|nr:hypothetical protein [Planctomycetota bacterium]
MTLWPILLIPIVVVASIALVLASRLIARAFKRTKSKRVVTFPRALIVVSVVLGIVLTVDYLLYQSREREVSDKLSALGVELDRIAPGWPGSEYYARLERPLNDQELEQLTVLNSLVGRNGVVITVNYEITKEQLSAVRKALPECTVVQLTPITNGNADRTSPMNQLSVGSLRTLLDAERVRSDAYCLTGGLPNEQYCIETTSGQWYVYYSERGCKTGLRE